MNIKTKEYLFAGGIAVLLTFLFVRKTSIKKTDNVKPASDKALQKMNNATIVLKAYKLAKANKEPMEKLRELNEQSMSQYGMKVMLNEQRQLCVVDANKKCVITDKS